MLLRLKYRLTKVYFIHSDLSPFFQMLIFAIILFVYNIYKFTKKKGCWQDLYFVRIKIDTSLKEVHVFTDWKYVSVQNIINFNTRYYILDKWKYLNFIVMNVKINYFHNYCTFSIFFFFFIKVKTCNNCISFRL